MSGSPHADGPSGSSTAQEGLSSEFIEQFQEFLAHRFDDTELRWFVRCITNEEIAAALPGPQGSLTALATAAVSTLQRHGYLEDKDFFQRLYQARPRLRTAIDHLWRLWFSSRKRPTVASMEAPAQAQFHVRITASGNLSDLNYSSLEKLIALLREATKDTSIALEFVARGSIVIGLRCSESAHDQLRSIFVSGALPALPELGVLSVDSADSYLPPHVLDLHDTEVALKICGILADNFTPADLREWLRRRHYGIYSSLAHAKRSDQWSAYEIVAAFKSAGTPAELIISSLLDECPNWIVSRLTSPIQLSQRWKTLLWRLRRALTVLAVLTLPAYLLVVTIAAQSLPSWSGPSGVVLSLAGAVACPLLFYKRTRRPAVVMIAIAAVVLGGIFWSVDIALSAHFWLGTLPLSLSLWNRPTMQHLLATRDSTERADQSGVDFSQFKSELPRPLRSGFRWFDG